MRENEKTQEKSSELSAERVEENLNTTEQMETTAHDWKEPKISFHAGVRGGNKDGWCLIILAVSSANRHVSKTRHSRPLLMENDSSAAIPISQQYSKGETNFGHLVSVTVLFHTWKYICKRLEGLLLRGKVSTEKGTHKTQIKKLTSTLETSASKIHLVNARTFSH